MTHDMMTELGHPETEKIVTAAIDVHARAHDPPFVITAISDDEAKILNVTASNSLTCLSASLRLK